ncbi:hypothetical protein HZB96_02335 [Candidatus Gottesmanbacteria bacterium]|nr:hypothetical protein [Candidatus Gottesmanbacteria bacterium]
MNTTIIQIPVSKVLRNQAVKAAQESGFSSLQDVIRFFLTKLARKQIAVNLEDTTTPLSWKNEKRYLKMDKDFAKGKNVKSFSSVEELMRDLRS